MTVEKAENRASLAVLLLGALVMLLGVAVMAAQLSGYFLSAVGGVPAFITGGILTLLGFLYMVGYREQLFIILSFIAERIPASLFYSLVVILFIGSMVSLGVFLLFPEKVTSVKPGAPPDVQIFGCILSAGLLGGIFRQANANLRLIEAFERSGSKNLDEPHSYFAKFWKFLISILGSAVTALVLFLLLRAGILKSVEVDTFNVYGVTGVAVLAGYFTENLIRRLTIIYEHLFEPQSRSE